MIDAPSKVALRQCTRRGTDKRGVYYAYPVIETWVRISATNVWVLADTQYPGEPVTKVWVGDARHDIPSWEARHKGMS